MNIGMLWFDNDQKTAIPYRIERAAEYYRTKYGKRPDLCFVHPSMLPKENETANPSIKSGDIEVRPSKAVLPNHFWLGINNGVNSAGS